jgi:Ca2+-transporting ATPase
MGNRGTDVAREAASIVLLDDNFASIVQGIRLGRRIFANLSKAMAYILTVHVPIIIMSLLPVLLGWPLVLLPVHIVFLEFIIDPSCTLIFEGESEEPGAMKKPPRKLGTALFNKEVLIGSLLEGLIMSAVIFVTQYVTMLADWTYDKSRAMTFLLIVLMNISIIVVLSGRRAFADAFKNHGKSPLTIILFIVIAVLAFVYTSPQTLELFKFDALSFVEVGLGAVLALVTAFALLPVKKLFAK